MGRKQAHVAHVDTLWIDACGTCLYVHMTKGSREPTLKITPSLN